MLIPTFGNKPYQTVLVHGGPGAAGSLSSLGAGLQPEVNSLAPWQSALSVDGQILELKEQIETAAAAPVNLVGHSWGAWLVWLFAARYPALVNKLVLIAPGVFEESYVTNLMPTRLSRLTAEERSYFDRLMVRFQDPYETDKEGVMAEFGKLMRKADAYDEIELPAQPGFIAFEIYDRVWPEAAALRRSGALLAAGSQIKCPVVVFMGDYDSTPVEGVQVPLESVLPDFRLVVLEKCGHYPWAERFARENFMHHLKEILLTK